jgi:hypothetical protein
MNIIRHNRIIKIQRWWRSSSSIIELRKISNYLKSELNQEDLQDLSNKCESINRYCKGDGAGLLGGSLIDMMISRFFELKLKKYSEYHNGECDMKICDIPLSQKKINGKSTIALDWSKNNEAFVKDHFTQHILIINLKTEQWWMKSPKKKEPNDNTNYCDVIKSGIYIVDKNYCKQFIKLSSNNKTNTLIDNVNLYKMLQRSINIDLFIEIPPVNKIYDFDILNSFVPSDALLQPTKMKSSRKKDKLDLKYEQKGKKGADNNNEGKNKDTDKDNNNEGENKENT